MKIVLLPGMGGTGGFFDPLVAALPAGLEPVTVSYPVDECLDYLALEALVRSRLPADDFVLLGESFSAPIAYRIVTNPPANLRGVIFIGGFLTPPRPLLMGLSRLLPRTLLFAMPPPGYVLKTFLVGHDAKADIIDRIRDIKRSISPRVLIYRLDQIARLQIELHRCHLPALYLRGKQDRLVPPASVEPFRKSFANLKELALNGPHFILQTRPAESAALISEGLTALGVLVSQ